jgi:hypothetical protein
VTPSLARPRVRRPGASWLPIVKAAAVVGVSRRTLERWVTEGLMHTFLVMGDRRTWVDMREVTRLRAPLPESDPTAAPGADQAPGEARRC